MNLAAVRYKPEYHLDLGAGPIPALLRNAIIGLRFSSGLEGADRVELTIHDPALQWLEHEQLKLGTRLALSLGYVPQPLDQVFVGELVTMSSSFSSNGAITLDVAAHDARYQMQRSKKSRWFAIPGANNKTKPMPDLTVASTVSASHQLVPIFDPIAAGVSLLLGAVSAAVAVDDSGTVQKLIRHQQGQSDFDLLQLIAKENGWEMLVEHGEPLGGHKLRFMSPANELDPIATFEYGRSLIDFAPRLSNVGQVAKVGAKFWVPEIKTEFSASAGFDWDRNELVLQLTPGLGDFDDSGDSRTLELAGKQVDQYTAPRELVKELLAILHRRLTASVTVIGQPDLRAGEVVEIQGVGPFSSRYRIVDAVHTVDTGGYITLLNLRREIWFDTPSFAAPNLSFSF